MDAFEVHHSGTEGEGRDNQLREVAQCRVEQTTERWASMPRQFFRCRAEQTGQGNDRERGSGKDDERSGMEELSRNRDWHAQEQPIQVAHGFRREGSSSRTGRPA